VWKLRSFLNTDTPALVRLWNAHHAASHSGSQCNVGIWDTCVLSKPFFHSHELVLALDEFDAPVGFIHFGLLPVTTDQELTAVGAIHCLCIPPSPSEGDIAKQLIECGVNYLATKGASACQALGSGSHALFYLGIADGDNSMGILAQDQRTQAWFHESGFVPMRPTECWELELSTFRPPMDRQQIQARRNCTIGRMLEEDYEDWWTSAILGHCEQVRFHLMVKSPPSLGGVLTCWYPDSEVADVDNSIVRIVLPDVPVTETEREQFIYLVSESLRQLQQDRKRTVRAVASAEKQPTITLLQKLGFRSISHGLLFEKRIA
jgi:hypothetical protein